MNVRSVIQESEAKRRRGRPVVDDKRRRILDAALVTFAKKGYHGTTVPEVADNAGVGTGTVYRYFEHKEALVNEVYRDAKLRLRTALLENIPAPDMYELDAAKRWFIGLWRRLAAFARTQPETFRFLEMQDHVEYLDKRSRELEMSVLAPLWLAGKQLRDRNAGVAIDLAIAMVWGAFVGLVKAERLGYLKVDEARLAEAGAACWKILAPERTSSERVSPADLRIGGDPGPPVTVHPGAAHARRRPTTSRSRSRKR